MASGQTDLDEFAKDTDKDWLSDLLEQRLGTDSTAFDTEKDGLRDGKDGNPLTPEHKPDERTEIHQAVFTVLFAASNSRDVLAVLDTDDFAKQEYYGFFGWVIPVKSIRPRWVNIENITVKKFSPTTAEVTLRHSETPMASSFHVAYLEKKHGKWAVVDCSLFAGGVRRSPSS